MPKIALLKIPGKGDVLLTGDITELGIDSPPASYNVDKDLFECGYALFRKLRELRKLGTSLIELH